MRLTLLMFGGLLVMCAAFAYGIYALLSAASEVQP